MKKKIRIHNFVCFDLTITAMYLVIFYDGNLRRSTLLNRAGQIVGKMGEMDQNDPLVDKRLNKIFRDLHSQLVFKIWVRSVYIQRFSFLPNSSP